METQDRKGDDQHQGPGTPPGGETPAGGGEPAAGSQPVTTDDPAVRPGSAPASDPRSHPDRTTAIETSGIRKPDEASDPRLLLVPIAESPPRDRPGAGETGAGEGAGQKGRADQPRQDRDGGRAESGKQGEAKRTGPSQAPSVTRILLYAGVVSLICGVAGAWAYSYFFGPSKSSEQKSSGKGSELGKGSESDKGSGSDKGSESSKKGAGKGELFRAEEAWLAAVKELHQAQAAEKAARRSEEEARAVLDFFKRTLLSAGRPGDASLAEAFWSGGQGKDVTLRKALDGTEPQVAEAFADRPLGEASVREMLGLAYLNVGDAPDAVKQFERALALREAVQGANQPDTAACRNQLAVAYRLAGRTAEAGRLFDRNLNSLAEASALAVRGSILLREKKPAEAELKLRQSLTIRRKTGPDDWTTFDAESSLGEALLAQNKFAEAEPLLLSGYQGMKRREDKIPSQDKPRLAKALERLVKLYDAWGKEDESARWRKEVAAARSHTTGPP